MKKVKIKEDLVNSLKMKELYASVCGTTVNQMRENERTSKESKKYHNLPPDRWPKFELLWDTDKVNYIKTLDGYNIEHFKKNYPHGFLLGEISFLELNSKLVPHCVRHRDKIWESGSIYKLAEAILFWKENRKMTPILIGYYKDELIIGEGFHRHAICIIKNPKIIPILVLPSEKDRIEKTLTSIKWLT